MSSPDVRPAPLTPEGSELRSYDFFPLYHKRLRRSKWWKRASHVARSISVDLWCEAYEQTPVASLPNDDWELAGFAGFGRNNIEEWQAVREEVLAPWVLCSDDRYYHPVLAEIASEIWNTREERRRIEREKKARQRAGSLGDKDARPEGREAASPGDKAPVTPVRDHIGEERRGDDRGSGSTTPSVVAEDDDVPEALGDEEVEAVKPKAKPKPTGDPYDLARAVEAWNALAGLYDLPTATWPINDTRKAKLRLRLKELGGLVGWVKALEEVTRGPHLLGENDRGWRCNLDFMLQPSSLTKVIEGHYRRSFRNVGTSADRGRAEHQERLGRMLEGAMEALDGE